MKHIPRFSFAALAAVFLFSAAASFAFPMEKHLADPVLESRAKALFREVRCVVCEGQALAESNADLASDMRHLIRAQIQAGKSDAAIRAFLISRYGEAILMNPPKDSRTALLWYLPAFITVLGLGALFVRGKPKKLTKPKKSLKAATRKKK